MSLLIILLLLFGSYGAAQTYEPASIMFPPAQLYNEGLSVVVSNGMFQCDPLDGTTTTHSHTFVYPKAGDVSTVGFRVGTVTTAQDVTVSLQDVSLATGVCDGTVDQSCTVSSGAISANTVVTCTLGANRTVTRGELGCLRVAWTATQGNIQTCAIEYPTRLGEMAQHYFVLSGTKQNDGAMPYIRYSDSSFAWNLAIAQTSDRLTATTATTPDEAALKFQLPYGAQACGVWSGVQYSSSGDHRYYIENSGGTNLCTGNCATVDSDTSVSTSAPSAGIIWFDEVVNLAKDTTYYLIWSPTTTSNVHLVYYDVNEAAALEGWGGTSTDVWSQRTDAGAWTDNTTRRPMMGLVLCGVEAAGGGGQSAYGSAQ